MSTNNSNNSGNNSSGGTVVITGAGGGGGGASTTYIPNGNTFTFTIPLGGGWVTTGPIVEAAPAAEKKKKSDGCNCKKCKEFYPYAEPNQEDGTLICYACRHGY